MRGSSDKRWDGAVRWLTLLTLLIGSFAWIPGAAEEPGDPDPTAVSAVSLDCPVPATALAGTLFVSDPADNVVVNLELLVADTVVDTTDITLTAAQTDYDFSFPLAPGATSIGVTAKVVATLAGDSVSVTSDERAIADSQGETVCVPDDPGSTAVPTIPPTAEPTSTNVPEPTTPSTSVPEPTAPSTSEPSFTPTVPPVSLIGTVVNTGGANLNCRANPVNGAVITKLAPGATVPVTGNTTGGWVPVTCGGQAGWVSSDYLTISTSGGEITPTPTEPGDTSYVRVAGTGTDNLRCRTAPVSGATIVLLPPGTRMEVRGATEAGWTPITCGGQAGWASATYLVPDNGTSPTPTPPSGNGGTGKYVTITGTGGAGLRCRTAPVSGVVITLLADGARVETRGTNTGGWLPIICGGRNGFVSAEYVMVPMAVGATDLWFDVNLRTQYMRVYRGNTVIMETYVSTGRPGFDTPTGTYYINRKLVNRTMSGVLGGQYYNVPNVPWVMYFTNVGHAIHGAYWHNKFGQRMSHGCINLPVPFSETLYRMTPIGTRLRIHY